MLTILLLLFFAPPEPVPHPSDEICNVMTAHDPHPCSPEQRALLHTPHEHDAKGNLVLMTKGAHGEIVRTMMAPKDWLAKKHQELTQKGEPKKP